MKLPSSSSLIFATLAVSSSSTSLAAPTGDATQPPNGISASGSVRRGSISIPRSQTRDTADGEVEATGLLGLSKLCPLLSTAEGLLHTIEGTVAGLPAVGQVVSPLFGIVGTALPIVSQVAACAQQAAESTQEFDQAGFQQASTDSASSSPTGSPPPPSNTPATSSAAASTSGPLVRPNLPVDPPAHVPDTPDPASKLPTPPVNPLQPPANGVTDGSSTTPPILIPLDPPVAQPLHPRSSLPNGTDKQSLAKLRRQEATPHDKIFSEADVAKRTGPNRRSRHAVRQTTGSDDEEDSAVPQASNEDEDRKSNVGSDGSDD